MNAGPIIAGAVGLAVLDAVVSRPAAAARVGGVETGLAGFVHKFLSPTVPALTPVASSSTPAPTGTGPGGISTLPAYQMPSTQPTPIVQA